MRSRLIRFCNKNVLSRLGAAGFSTTGSGSDSGSGVFSSSSLMLAVKTGLVASGDDGVRRCPSWLGRGRPRARLFGRAFNPPTALTLGATSEGALACAATLVARRAVIWSREGSACDDEPRAFRGAERADTARSRLAAADEARWRLLLLTLALKSTSSTQPLRGSEGADESRGKFNVLQALSPSLDSSPNTANGDRMPGEGRLKWKMAGDSGGVTGDSAASAVGADWTLDRNTARRSRALVVCTLSVTCLRNSKLSLRPCFIAARSLELLRSWAKRS